MDNSAVESTYENKPKIAKPAYAVIGCTRLQDLPVLINIEVEDGYEPIGGPFYHAQLDRWCQALYRRPQVARLPDVASVTKRAAR